MDACLAVEREVEKVVEKFEAIQKHSDSVLTGLADCMDNLKKEFEDCSPDHKLTQQQVSILKQSLTKIRNVTQGVASNHRDLHSTVSRVGKAIDRNFIADFSSCSKPSAFTGPENSKLLDQVICQHLYRQGMIDVAQSLSREADLKMAEEETEPFTEMNKILTALRVKDLEPLIQWVHANREKLNSINSSLEFKIHRLRFVSLVEKGVLHQGEAIQYARMHFIQFATRYEKEIQNLMGMFLYLPNGIPDSPYSRLMESTLWPEIVDTFTSDACTLMGFSVDSPLSISVSAGCSALPALLNIKQVMQQRQFSGMFSGKDELPIEIEIGQERYHSMFACPILRQQSSDHNPPMRLVCGHVISKDALTKLSNSANKLKCPYCPVEQNTADAKLIYF